MSGYLKAREEAAAMRQWALEREMQIRAEVVKDLRRILYTQGDVVRPILDLISVLDEQNETILVEIAALRREEVNEAFDG